jgi:sugar/nucleoside kinase (ribokinase family)
MRKFIIIGEASLSIDLNASTHRPAAGGLFLNVASELARRGNNTLFLSEIGVDPVGNIIADHLTGCGVDISCCDRFSEGQSPITIALDGATERYVKWPEGEGFDIVWPRIEKEDIVVVGGYLSLDARVRHRLAALVANAVERNATVVYIPDVADCRITRITKVMPTVFENLETASVVITLPDDLKVLYSYDDAMRAYKDHISFYCTSMEAISAGNPVVATAFGQAPTIEAADTVVDAIVNILQLL